MSLDALTPKLQSKQHIASQSKYFWCSALNRIYFSLLSFPPFSHHKAFWTEKRYLVTCSLTLESSETIYSF